MKMRLVLVLLSVFCAPLAAFATPSFLGGGPTPEQSFHSATSDQKHTEALQMEKVKAIMAKAAKEQALKKQTAKQQVVKQGINSKKLATNTIQSEPTVTLSKGTSKELASEISELNQTNLLFQQQTDQRIHTLQSENNNLQAKVVKLDDALGILNQEVNKLDARYAKPAAVNAEVHQASDTAALLNNTQVQYLLLAIAILLLTILTMQIVRRKPAAKAVTANGVKTAKQPELLVNDDDTKDEYDFMATTEAIPAKLDLARAYIAMEDYSAARQVLDKVIAEGDETQQQEAQQLVNALLKKD